MYLKDTECCAIQEICALGQHKDAKEAMMSFCAGTLDKRVRFSSSPSAGNSLFCFYLFTAAVGGYMGRTPYGADFAKLIKSCKLGDVWASPQVVNKAYHPDHSNQVWVWTPDQEALQAWWDENKPTAPTVQPADYSVDDEDVECDDCGYNIDDCRCNDFDEDD